VPHGRDCVEREFREVVNIRFQKPVFTWQIVFVTWTCVRDKTESRQGQNTHVRAVLVSSCFVRFSPLTRFLSRYQVILSFAKRTYSNLCLRRSQTKERKYENSRGQTMSLNDKFLLASCGVEIRKLCTFGWHDLMTPFRMTLWD